MNVITAVDGDEIRFRFRPVAVFWNLRQDGSAVANTDVLPVSGIEALFSKLLPVTLLTAGHRTPMRQAMYI